MKKSKTGSVFPVSPLWDNTPRIIAASNRWFGFKPPTPVNLCPACGYFTPGVEGEPHTNSFASCTGDATDPTNRERMEGAVLAWSLKRKAELEEEDRVLTEELKREGYTF